MTSTRNCYNKNSNHNIGMGGVCDQVDHKQHGRLQQIITSTSKNQYEQANLAQEPFLTDKLEQIGKADIFYTNFQENRILMKHKTKDLYYLGDWSQAGYQQGKGIVYAIDQYLYYGEFDSVPHGYGTLESIVDKYIYEGQFYYGKIEGQGRARSTEGLFQFEGTFNSKSEPSTGVLTVNNPNNQALSYTVSLDNYPENKAKISYKEGREYEGQINFHRFVPEGRGIARYSNNSTYEGEWLNGQFHGKGSFTWSDGSQYAGEYEQGKKHGKGRFVYPSRKVYEGEWRNGKQHGQGVLYDADENVLKKGNWQDGHFIGQ